MECQSITKYLKLNRKKSIGDVIIVVEGSLDEFKLLKQIFHNVLGYKYLQHPRNKQTLKEYDKYIMKGNENSQVSVINTEESAIKTINNKSEYLSYMYELLYKKHGINYKNSRIYFLWDRDCGSNLEKLVKELLSKLNNPIENEDYDMQGLLLLNYPCVESYLISNFKKVPRNKMKDPKEYIKENQIYISEITKDTLIKAVCNMHSCLQQIGIREYSLDNFKVTNEKIFKIQEEIYNDTEKYRLLSLLSIILIDLDIITERE